MLCRAVPCCAMLCCAMLRCTVLCCAGLHRALQRNACQKQWCDFVVFLVRWMTNFAHANWDLAVIYSGNQTQFSCPDCVHVELNKGAKWLLVYSFTQSTAWQNEYQHRYQMVYVPDDDILQTTATVNRVFDIHAQYSLLISQPALCSWLESHTASWDMVKWPTTVLRYTNFVEIMVPLFSMAVFNSTVISTMSHAETGKLTVGAWYHNTLICAWREHVHVLNHLQLRTCMWHADCIWCGKSTSGRCQMIRLQNSMHVSMSAAC